jgi:hypothetical protein
MTDHWKYLFPQCVVRIGTLLPIFRPITQAFVIQSDLPHQASAPLMLWSRAANAT